MKNDLNYVKFIFELYQKITYQIVSFYNLKKNKKK